MKFEILYYRYDTSAVTILLELDFLQYSSTCQQSQGSTHTVAATFIGSMGGTLDKCDSMKQLKKFTVKRFPTH